MPEQRVNILVYKPDGTLIARYLLGDGEHLIGRDINCPIYLDSEYISTRHAQLTLCADGIFIEDFNSTSGTFLDSVTVRGRLRIKPGQVLQMGDLTIDLQPESEDQVGPGSRLGGGRYTLNRLLGRGGMGEVWLAKDEQLEEEVALKKLPPEVSADAMALNDMRREVQKSRGLSHPNIIRIHDLVQQPGEDPLITLEYVDGTDLTAIAATKTNGIFSWGEIKEWPLQLCEALDYAHKEKIVHRDLKPGNLMITRDGRLKLADFGIAASMADSLSRSSVQGYVSGTALYMSPQQMEGEAPQASDDIYAFGSTVYELLTGKPPFYTGKVEHQVLNVTPKPMDQRLTELGFTNEIPGYVNQLVMACLAKNPEGRPKDMGAIREWIESEGKLKGILPKVSTKTLRKERSIKVVAEGLGKGGRHFGCTLTFACAIVAIPLATFLIYVGKKGTALLPKYTSADAPPARLQAPTKPEGPTKKETPINTEPGPPPLANIRPVNPTNPTNPTNPAIAGKERLLWKFETGGDVASSPAIGSDGTVYVGSHDEKLYALSGKSGGKLWEFKAGNS